MSLTKHIVKHIIANLGVDSNVAQKLKSKEYLLQEQIVLEYGDSIQKHDIWGCQFLMEQRKLTILLSEIELDPGYEGEYCGIVHLEGSPTYGFYYSQSDEVVREVSLIACSMNGKDWMKCSTYLQATFLAGMEQVKDIGHIQQRCTNYQEEYQSILSFLKYTDDLYDEYEETQGR